jgi:hypothetical protein
MIAFTHCYKLIKFLSMIFAAFEEKSIKSSYRFEVIGAVESPENGPLAEIGSRCHHLTEKTSSMGMPA